MSKSSNSRNAFYALLTGAAIGAGIGLLYAPDKGKNTRKKIKRRAVEAKNDLQKGVKRAKKEITRTANKKQEEFEQKLDGVISSMNNKAENVIAVLERRLEELKKQNMHHQN